MPGLLKDINYVFTWKEINSASQFLQTDTEIGYVIIDIESQLSKVILQELKNIPHIIRAWMLYWRKLSTDISLWVRWFLIAVFIAVKNRDTLSHFLVSIYQTIGGGIVTGNRIII
jgi:hypothetical protein